MAHSEAPAAGALACLRYLALLGFSYGLLLLTLGFRLYEDAAIPPWAAFLKYPEKFQKDFLFQSLEGTLLSERTGAAHLYSLLIDRWRLVPVVHAIFSLLLIAGIERLARYFIGSGDFHWVAVWLLLPGLYHQHWGSNELYYAHVQPSLLAKAMGVWAWVGLLEKRVTLSTLTLVACALIHPSVGWQVAIFSAPLIKGLSWRQRALQALAVGLVLVQTLLVGRSAWPSPESQKLWETVYLEFRMGMHFAPPAFKPKSHVLFPVLLGIAFYLTWRRKHLLRWVFLLYALGLGAYVLNYYTLRWPPLWYSQLFRATVWLKPLALFTILSGILSLRRLSWRLSTGWSLVLMGLIAVPIYRLARHEYVGKRFLQVLEWGQSPAYLIGRCAQAVLPDTAVLAAAPTHEAQAAQFFAMRSSFLRLDAHLRAADAEGYRKRVRLLYGVDPGEGLAAWERLTAAGQIAYDSLARHQGAQWQSAGITHIITDGLADLPFPCLCRYESLALWALPTAAADRGIEGSSTDAHPVEVQRKPTSPLETAPLKTP